MVTVKYHVGSSDKAKIDKELYARKHSVGYPPFMVTVGHVGLQIKKCKGSTRMSPVQFPQLAILSAQNLIKLKKI